MNPKIYQEIKRRILFLEYEPGQYICEKDLAAEFGVSRTPVREVLLRLEWEKLVSIMPRLGIMVTKIDFQESRDVYRSRMVVEGAIGKLASKNITDSHLTEMQTLLTTCKTVNDDSSREEIVHIDAKFRDILFRAANSPTMRNISDYLYCQTQRIWYLTFDKSDIPTVLQSEAKEIEDTIAIFSKRDPDLAEEFRRKVIMSYVEWIYKYFIDY